VGPHGQDLTDVQEKQVYCDKMAWKMRLVAEAIPLHQLPHPAKAIFL
jgi:hypothetical protein